MHELSIAISMIELAEEEAIRHGGATVSAIHLRLGRLSGVAREALESCYEIACERTALEGSKLVIEEVPVVVSCPRCQTQRTVDPPNWFACPECSGSVEVVQGRELEVSALELAEVPA